MSPQHLDTMIYVDDSGHPQNGTVVYGWLSFSPAKWSDVLGSWMTTRKKLAQVYGVPVTQELHMTDYVLGRGRISTRPPKKYIHDGTVYWKDLGKDVAVECLETLKSIEGLSTGAVYFSGNPQDLAANRKRVYRWLVNEVEEKLSASDSLGIIYMDGDGSERTYRDIHRSLPRTNRRIIEDPVYLDSSKSQFMQMADHVAWCANASLSKVPKHSFAHSWYEDYLAVRDRERCPRLLQESNLSL